MLQKDDVPKDQLLLAVCEDGSVALNRTPYELDALRTDLSKRLRSKAKKVVFIDAHPDAGYENVVALLDVARDAGAERLGLASLKTGEDFTACSAPEATVIPEEAEAPAG